MGAGLAHGLTVRQALSASTLAGASVLAGARGLDRVVERMNVMEVPDILPWVKPHEFLLTTAYPLRESPGRLVDLVGELDTRGLSGLGIKIGRYIDEIPPEMLTRAEELGFPLVKLPDGVGFDDILNEVLTEILNLQASALARSERIHRTLVQIVLSGGGLAEIAADLAGLLDATILIADPDGRLLASSGDGSLQGAVRRLGLLDGDERVRLPSEDGPDSMCVPVSAGGRLHGHILATGEGRPLEADDLLALENAAMVAALAITKSAAVAAVEGRYRSELLHDLLGGRIRDAGEASARAAALGWDIDRPVVVLVVTCRQVAEEGARTTLLDRLTHALDDAARARDHGAATVASSREVVVITGAPGLCDEARSTDDARALGETLRRSAQAATGLCLRVGISRVACSPLDVPGAHEQAIRAERIGGGGAVTHFDDLGAFRLLSLISDQHELDRYVADVLGPVAAADAATVDLRLTLETVLSNNLNIAESARRLHFHYNTLRYRVDKLERMLGPFTQDPSLRLNIELALQALRLRNGLAPHAAGEGLL